MRGDHWLGGRLEDIASGGGLRDCWDTEQVDSFALVILGKYVLRGTAAITEDIADGFGHIADHNVVGGIGCVGEQLAGLDARFQGVGLGCSGELLLSLNRFNSVGLCVLVAHEDLQTKSNFEKLLLRGRFKWLLLFAFVELDQSIN